MFRPLHPRVKKESKRPRISIDDVFSDDDDCVLSSPPPKRITTSQSQSPVQCQGVETFWITEDEDSVSLIVLRNPNVKCVVTTVSQDSISMAWLTTVPPDEVLLLISGGLKSAFQAVHPKQGSILLKVQDGQVQQDQTLWTIKVFEHHAVFVIPKVSAIEAISSEC